MNGEQVGEGSAPGTPIQPGAVQGYRLLASVLKQAQSAGATEIRVVRKAGTTDIAVVLEGRARKVFKTSADQAATMLVALRERVFLWPSISELRHMPADGAPRLYLQSGELNFAADLDENAGEDGTVLSLRNCVYGALPTLSDILRLDAESRIVISGALGLESGIVAVNPPSVSFPDGLPLFAAARPEAFILRCGEPGWQQRAMQLATRSLVFVTSPAEDPIQLLLQLLAPLEGDPAGKKELMEMLRLVLVQRRIPRICTECARTTKTDDERLARLPEPIRHRAPTTYRHAMGCEHCKRRGTYGSVALESILEIDEPLRKLVGQGAPASQLTEHAYLKGTRSLIERGLEQVHAGALTFDHLFEAAPRLPPAFHPLVVKSSVGGDETPLDSRLRSSLERLDDDFFLSKKEKAAERQQPAIEHSPSASPATPSPAVKAPDQSANRAAAAVKTRLLVVEDDNDQRQVLEIVFQTDGYEVGSASNCKDAWKLLKESHFDVIVCDLMMPGANGDVLVRDLRRDEQLKHIPVLMLTAVNTPEAEYNLLATGADDYCAKTVQKKILLKRVERLVARTRKNPLDHLLGD